MNAPQPKAVAQAHQLSLSWDGRVVFENLDLSLPPGVTLVRGDEQTGKTSLLRILAGDLPPTSGWVEVLGVRADQQMAAYAQTVFRADSGNSALDHISAAQWQAGLPEEHPNFSMAFWRELIEGFDLLLHIDKPMYMLSAGSRRKVAICGAMASGAALTLLDQPFAALDTPSIRLLREVLQSFTSQNKRAIVVTDYQAIEGLKVTCTVELVNLG